MERKIRIFKKGKKSWERGCDYFIFKYFTFLFTEQIFQNLDLSFKFQRSITHHLTHVYIPSSFLVIMTWGTFWLPSSTYPARVTLIVTNFLASTYILQGDIANITRVPYATALEVFLLGNITFILAAMLEYIIVLKSPWKFTQKGTVNEVGLVKIKISYIFLHFLTFSQISPVHMKVYSVNNICRKFHSIIIYFRYD